jgi:hypothetical protein
LIDKNRSSFLRDIKAAEQAIRHEPPNFYSRVRLPELVFIVTVVGRRMTEMPMPMNASVSAQSLAERDTGLSRFSAQDLSLMLRATITAEITFEPFRCQTRHFLQGTHFLKQMGRSATTAKYFSALSWA